MTSDHHTQHVVNLPFPCKMQAPELPPMEMDSQTHRSVAELMAQLSSADSITDPTQRDAALIDSLRTIRQELDMAQKESNAAKARLDNAQDVFNLAAHYLAGGSVPLESSRTEDAASSHHLHTYNTTKPSPLREPSRTKLTPKSYEESLEEPLPTNPILMPPTYTSGADLTEEMTSAHRESFYRTLLGISSSEVDSYIPNEKQPNLRSKAQLVEGMHIVEHWYTGADGLDVGAFRSKHKTWYTRMKPNTSNLGRRTGIHVRALAPSLDSEGGETVLCRYNKEGNRSIVYLDVGKVYDALFEIHTMDGHKSREVCKAKVDELYANVPDGQVKVFIETCPICVERKEEGKVGPVVRLEGL